MDLLINSIVARPYVFIFLIAFLTLSIIKFGWFKTIIWLVSGYLIAWLSEFSSIHNGFPYGEYHYIYENLKGELLIGGVPFFDSLSYPFLVFAGYTTAEFILSKLSGLLRRHEQSQEAPRNDIHVLPKILLGAFLTMMLDVIIDPAATMGDKWFLGKIHYYANPGWYFGVPLTNFAGWFLVALAIITFNMTIWGLLRLPPRGFARNDKNSKLKYFYPAFYIGIAAFSIVIAFIIDEFLLGLCGIVYIILIFTIPYLLKSLCHQR